MGTAEISSASKCKLPRTEVQLAPQLDNGVDYEHAFTVLTFNCLADGLAQDGDFVMAPPEVLTWQYRLPLILQEVLEPGADVICLQEANHFDEIASQLAKAGYGGFHLPKCPSPCERFGCPPDGVALFYRTQRFACITAPIARAFVDGSGKPASQGFLAVLLEDRDSGRSLCVASTHLKAKEGAENDAARLCQARQLLAHLEEAYRQPAGALGAAPASSSSPRASGNGAGSAPARAAAAAAAPAARGNAGGWEAHTCCGVVAAGDFNTTPDSAACAALGSSTLLQLQSLWDVAHQQAVTGPEFTTWKFRSKGESMKTIDYLWFSPQQLVPLSRWRMLQAAEIGRAALPCARYPSDHVAVMARFGWRLR